MSQEYSAAAGSRVEAFCMSRVRHELVTIAFNNQCALIHVNTVTKA